MASTAVAVTVIVLIQRWFTNPPSSPPAGPPQVSHFSHEKSKIWMNTEIENLKTDT